jgi:hypothetical protein
MYTSFSKNLAFAGSYRMETVNTFNIVLMMPKMSDLVARSQGGLDGVLKQPSIDMSTDIM